MSGWRCQGWVEPKQRPTADVRGLSPRRSIAPTTPVEEAVPWERKMRQSHIVCESVDLETLPGVQLAAAAAAAAAMLEPPLTHGVLRRAARDDGGAKKRVSFERGAAAAAELVQAALMEAVAGDGGGELPSDTPAAATSSSPAGVPVGCG